MSVSGCFTQVMPIIKNMCRILQKAEKYHNFYSLQVLSTFIGMWRDKDSGINHLSDRHDNLIMSAMLPCIPSASWGILRSRTISQIQLS